METEHFLDHESSDNAEAKEMGKELLFQDSYVEIYHPIKQAVPKQEGVQLVINPLQDDLINDIRAEYLGLAVAKVMAEGRYTEEFWANIHKNAHPETNKGINVFGKNPQSEHSWGKPVDIRPEDQRVEDPLDRSAKEKLSRTLESYIPKWEEAGQRIILFEEGLNAVDTESELFKEQREKSVTRGWPWHAYTAWMSDKYELTVVMVPHIKGAHLVLSPLHQYWSEVDRSDYKQPDKSPIKSWETPGPGKAEGSLEYLKGQVESYTLLLGVKEILEKNNFFNGEIHFSGNWGFVPLDALPEDERRQVDNSFREVETQEELEQKRKSTKVEHLTEHWLGLNSGWASHGHFYATDSPEKYVHLPSQPKTRMPGEWKDIPEYTIEEAENISKLIQTSLNKWVEDNGLINKNLFPDEESQREE